MRKEKLRKAGDCFLTGCFIKPFKIIINHLFLFYQAHSQCSFLRDIKRGIWEREIARNGKSDIYFKTNSNILVMKLTQVNFLK